MIQPQHNEVVSDDKEIYRTPVTQVRKKFKRHRLQSEENPRIREAIKMLGAVSSSPLQADECGVYGQHVGNKLRHYSKMTQAIVQHNINNILFNADMGQYDGDNKFSNFPSTNAYNITTTNVSTAYSGGSSPSARSSPTHATE